MNINAIQKHYDKLTIKERFALLVAAGARKDDQDRDALLRSAPRKVFSFPNTYGLSDAFEWLAMWHVMNQLGLCASAYYITIVVEDESELTGVKIAGRPFNFEDALDFLFMRIMTNCEAWRAICKEYGIDPEKILEGLPYIEMIELSELTARAAYLDAPLELPELQETVNGYREVIETKRKQWE
ncbi:MAG: hypothetical protein AABZ00_14520 [Chloroflexota bacterium]